MKKDALKIAGEYIEPGEDKEILLSIAKLPSDTVIETPVRIYRSTKPGPVLLLTGGLHGDEINGIEIVRRIISEEYNHCDAGTTICMPIVNIYGFLNYSRELPDGKDINRMFPGSKNGSLGSAIAYNLMKKIVPAIDYGIDFHSGGGSRTNYPQVRCIIKDKTNLALAKAFAAPFIIDAPFREKSFRKTAARKGKHILVFEGGESNRLSVKAISEGVRGTQRLMQHLGMIERAPAQKHEPTILNGCNWMRAKASGIFHNHVKCGEYIKTGHKMGTITDPFGRGETIIKATAEGFVIGLNNSPVISLGEALYNIGSRL